jgi:predicted transcriptional regulator
MMVNRRRKVGKKKVKKMRTDNKDLEDDGLKAVPEYKWDAVKELIDRQRRAAVREKKDQSVLVLAENEICEIASKERLRIIRLVHELKWPYVQDIADKLGRDPGAVSRDISILERTGIVRKVRVGKAVKILPSAEIIVLPIIGTDLFHMLEHAIKSGKEDSLDDVVDTLEELMILSVVYDKILPKLDANLRGQKELTILITKWVLQELDELPARLIKRLQSLPKEYFDEKIEKKEQLVCASRTTPSGS